MSGVISEVKIDGENGSPGVAETKPNIPGHRNRPKILFVGHSGAIAGAERVLVNMVRFLRDTPFDLLVTVRREGELKQELEACGVRVLVQPVALWIPYKTRNKRYHLRAYLEGLGDRVSGIARIIQGERVDIVHSNVNVILEGALAAAMTGRPHVWHNHTTFRGNPDHSSWIPRSLIPYVYHILSDVILCCSSFTAEDLFPRNLRKKVRVLYNGIDVTSLTPEPPQHDLRDELGLRSGIPLVGLLGTVNERKRQLEFVEAAALVRKAIPNVQFVFAGYNAHPQTYTAQILRRIDELNAQDYIHYLDYRLDYVDIMKSLDVYVLASRQEQLPLVLLEAMACGKPVVSTRCGGSSEVVVDKETGLLVDVGNTEQLAKAIIGVLLRCDRGTSLGMRGRERVVSLFDSRKCLRNLPTIYEELLDMASQNRGILRRLIAPHLISLFLRTCSSGPRGYDRVRQQLRKFGSYLPI